MQFTRRLHCGLGLLVGTSSNANVAAVLRLARDLPLCATIVTQFCHHAERYFSTRLFVESDTKGTIPGTH